MSLCFHVVCLVDETSAASRQVSKLGCTKFSGGSYLLLKLFDKMPKLYAATS